MLGRLGEGKYAGEGAQGKILLNLYGCLTFTRKEHDVTQQMDSDSMDSQISLSRSQTRKPCLQLGRYPVTKDPHGFSLSALARNMKTLIRQNQINL